MKYTKLFPMKCEMLHIIEWLHSFTEGHMLLEFFLTFPNTSLSIIAIIVTEKYGQLFSQSIRCILFIFVYSTSYRMLFILSVDGCALQQFANGKTPVVAIAQFSLRDV